MITIPTGPNDKPIKPLGVVWYDDEATYIRMQEICADMVRASYEEWHTAATASLEEREENGQPRQKVAVKPDLFVAWCAAGHHQANAIARQRYVYDAIEAAFTLALKRHKAKKKAKRSW